MSGEVFFPAILLGSPTIMIQKGQSLTSAKIIDSKVSYQTLELGFRRGNSDDYESSIDLFMNCVSLLLDLLIRLLLLRLSFFVYVT